MHDRNKSEPRNEIHSKFSLDLYAKSRIFLHSGEKAAMFEKIVPLYNTPKIKTQQGTELAPKETEKMTTFDVSSWKTSWQGGASTNVATNSFQIKFNKQTMGGSMWHPVSTRYGSLCAKIDFQYYMGTNLAFYLTSVQNNENTPGWDEVDIEFIATAKPGYSSNFFQGGKDNTKFIGQEGGSNGGQHCLYWNWEKYGTKPGCTTWTLNGKIIREMCNYYGHNKTNTLHPVISYWANTDRGNKGMGDWMGVFDDLQGDLVATYHNVVYKDLSKSSSQPEQPEQPKPTTSTRKTRSRSPRTRTRTRKPASTANSNPGNDSGNGSGLVSGDLKPEVSSVWCSGNNGLIFQFNVAISDPKNNQKIKGSVLLKNNQVEISKVDSIYGATSSDVNQNTFVLTEQKYQVNAGGQVILKTACDYSSLPTVADIKLSFVNV